MRTPYRKYLLSTSQKNAIEKLARRSKIDCWFSLEDRADPSGIIYTGVYDLEHRSRISLQYGVRLLSEGSSDLKYMGKDYGLSRKEISEIRSVYELLGII